MKIPTLFLSKKALLQKNKSGSFSGIYLKNAKPQSLFLGFALFEPKSRRGFLALFASFWLNQAIFALK
jgi:hypothetical protein